MSLPDKNPPVDYSLGDRRDIANSINDNTQRKCPKCGAQLEHVVDTQNSSCPDEYWKCTKCDYREA